MIRVDGEIDSLLKVKIRFSLAIYALRFQETLIAYGYCVSLKFVGRGMLRDVVESGFTRLFGVI